METLELTKKIERLPTTKRAELSSYIDDLLKSVEQTKTKQKVKKAVFGSAKGNLWMADDFDAPLDDFKEYM